jgi:lysophospholipase L1-like esterase
MLHRFSRVIALPLAPILFAQGRRLRRTIPRLPDAGLPWTGQLDGRDPLRLLVLGDSTAAGVGATTQADALPGHLARQFSERLGRGTVWAALGRNGATAHDVITDHLGEATSQPFDVVFLTIGANDALGMRSRSAFSRDVRQIVDALHAVNADALILVSLMPRFDRFESLRNPVKWNLALHAASLDAGARASVAGLDRVFAIPKPPPYTPTFWATDGFHPGPDGYREWAEFALDAVPEQLLKPLWVE